MLVQLVPQLLTVTVVALLSLVTKISSIEVARQASGDLDPTPLVLCRQLDLLTVDEHPLLRETLCGHLLLAGFGLVTAPL